MPRNFHPRHDNAAVARYGWPGYEDTQLLKPDISAMPPTRMRWPRRVIVTFRPARDPWQVEPLPLLPALTRSRTRLDILAPRIQSNSTALASS